MSKSLIKKVLGNKIIVYLSSRYLIYLLQFINSIIIAVNLGPYYLGVWGFSNLIIQYFNQIDFGVTQSFNALGSIHKEDNEYVSELLGSTIIIEFVLCALACMFLILIQNSSIGLGDKYNFSHYYLVVILSIILNYFVPTLLSLLRIYGDIQIISICQSLLPILNFLFMFFFKGEVLLLIMLWLVPVSLILTVALCLIKLPIKIKFSWNFELTKKLMKKGLHLFLYSSSFYFILYSTRSFVSMKYTVEEFGLFTFAFSLANAIILLFKSFSFLVFPKLINRLSKSGKDALALISGPRQEYMTMTHLVAHLAILFFPLFIYFIPKYTGAVSMFSLTVLGLIIYNNCYGFQELLIAKGRDRKLGSIAFISLTVNVIAGLILVFYFFVPPHIAIFSIVISYFTFLFLLAIACRSILEIPVDYKEIIMDAFPIRLLVPYLFSMYVSLSSYNNYFLYIIVLLIFLVLNRKELLNIKKTIVVILNNPNLVNV
ncbi:hypothetical protein WAE58_24790 [Pedobacter panaciterrae]|uniref:O-antigen/teichoic acid export membrane protein n=1 Tax=Pedobacter panaciterrae TaxID=363849 RepID=A0ABU8NTU7_9SPHI